MSRIGICSSSSFIKVRTLAVSKKSDLVQNFQATSPDPDRPMLWALVQEHRYGASIAAQVVSPSVEEAAKSFEYALAFSLVPGGRFRVTSLFVTPKHELVGKPHLAYPWSMKPGVVLINRGLTDPDGPPPFPPIPGKDGSFDYSTLKPARRVINTTAPGRLPFIPPVATTPKPRPTKTPSIAARRPVTTNQPPVIMRHPTPPSIPSRSPTPTVLRQPTLPPENMSWKDIQKMLGRKIFEEDDARPPDAESVWSAYSRIFKSDYTKESTLLSDFGDCCWYETPRAIVFVSACNDSAIYLIKRVPRPLR